MDRVAVRLLPLVMAFAGCTFVLSPDEAQCELDADCAERGFADATCVEGVCSAGTGGGGDPVWGCLGNVVECMSMSPDFPKGLVPDANGVVTANVRQGFDGFARITHPDIVPSRVYVGRPIVELPKVKEIQLLRPSEYSALANIAMGTVDPMRGTAILLVVDCQGDSGAGVRFETPSADGQTLSFYLINQAPVATATATDRDGFGGFFNLPPGSTLARATLAADNTYVGESSFEIRAGTISYVQIAPTPQ